MSGAGESLGLAMVAMEFRDREKLERAAEMERAESNREGERREQPRGREKRENESVRSSSSCSGHGCLELR
jgi:hypothetical protein